MTLTRHHGGVIIVLSFAAAMLLTIIPLPDGLRTLRPDWVVLTLIFWCLVLGRGFGAGTRLLLLRLDGRGVRTHPNCRGRAPRGGGVHDLEFAHDLDLRRTLFRESRFSGQP